MKKEAIVYGVSGIVAGLLIAWGVVVASTASQKTDMDMSMGTMQSQLEGKQDGKFDETFLSLMIIHHQAGIDMARLAEKSAHHSELKKLGKNIVSVQADEVAKMKEWQKKWGYETAGHAMK